MSIFKRLQDIISANMGEMVDSFENPEPMLKQAIREMETAVGDAKQETAKAIANEKLVRKELADYERQARDCQQRAEQALTAGDEALARKALARKREHDKVIAALQDQLTAAAEAGRTLRHQYEAMQVKLGEARRSLATLAARHKAAEVRKQSLNVNLDTDAFAKFDRLSEKVVQAEAEADALRELEGFPPKKPEVESEATHDELGVEAELEELKKKLHC